MVLPGVHIVLWHEIKLEEQIFYVERRTFNTSEEHCEHKLLQTTKIEVEPLCFIFSVFSCQNTTKGTEFLPQTQIA